MPSAATTSVAPGMSEHILIVYSILGRILKNLASVVLPCLEARRTEQRTPRIVSSHCSRVWPQACAQLVQVRFAQAQTDGIGFVEILRGVGIGDS